MEAMKEISFYFVSRATTIKEALQRMDSNDEKILLLTDPEGVIKGSITDGDIRRHILATGGLDGGVEQCANMSPIFIGQRYKKATVRELFRKHSISTIPVVDEGDRVVKLLRWSDYMDNQVDVEGEKIAIPVVINAGGMGTRLEPFTKILPKPLIPVGDKPIIEVIMDRFARYGVNEFKVILNYKGEMIRSYFDNIQHGYDISYIKEKDFLGTAGGLKLLPGDFSENFVLSNCDIVVGTNYADLLRFHLENQNTITIVGSMQRHKIPYGVLKFSRNGALESIVEKPEYDFTVNTGIYIINKRAIDWIVPNKVIHITDLIAKMMEEKEKVGVFPVSEGDYIDIGQWDEFKKNLHYFV